MSLEVTVHGAATFRKVAAQMRAVGQGDLAKGMNRALSKATNPLRDSIRESAAQTMPHSGGYAAVLEKSLRFRINQHGGGNTASVTLTTYADGTSERRDVVALESGRLRHPVFGRSGPGRKGERVAHAWSVTSIRSGFHRRGTDGAMDNATKAMAEVIEDYARRLIK
jgi:hypothetical protein